MSRGEMVRICLTKQERAGQMGNVPTYEVILTDAPGTQAKTRD
jgi:hypothetical protein